MNSHAKLEPTILVKGVETTPAKYIKFKNDLRTICEKTFDDGTYIWKNLESQLFESINSRDKGLLDYEKLINETDFALRLARR